MMETVKEMVVRIAKRGYNAKALEIGDTYVIRIKKNKHEYYFKVEQRKSLEQYCDEVIKMFKLTEYGFSERQAKKLIAGDEVATPYGTVKLNGDDLELETTYEDGSKKIENI